MRTSRQFNAQWILSLMIDWRAEECWLCSPKNVMRFHWKLSALCRRTAISICFFFPLQHENDWTTLEFGQINPILKLAIEFAQSDSVLLESFQILQLRFISATIYFHYKFCFNCSVSNIKSTLREKLLSIISKKKVQNDRVCPICLDENKKINGFWCKKKASVLQKWCLACFHCLKWRLRYFVQRMNMKWKKNWSFHFENIK